MDVQKIIPKVVQEDKRTPLKTGETEGKIHMGTVTPIGDDAIKKAVNPAGEKPVEAPKTKELQLDDMTHWIVAGITKENNYIYQIKKNSTVNDLLGLLAWLKMKVESDIAVHQKMDIGLFAEGIEYLVKVQEQYNKVTATRLAETTLALQTQQQTLQNFINSLIQSKQEADAVATKKKPKKK